MRSYEGLKGSKVVVYGLGYNYDFHRKFIESYFCVVGYTDKDKDKDKETEPFVQCDNIQNDYDYVLITTDKYYCEIRDYLISSAHIPKERIIGMHNVFSEVLFNCEQESGLCANYSVWSFMLSQAIRGLNMFGGDFDYDNNGERNVLRYIKEKILDARVIFDGGANVGLYAKIVMSEFPQATIYCFEPLKATFAMLKKNLQNEKHVVFCNVGLDNQNQVKVLYFDKPGSGLSSIYNRQIQHLVGFELDKVENVKVKSIDSICRENNIACIDILKLDIEGNEYNALLGAQQMINARSIRYIIIEFGGCNIDSRTFFRDFWNLLSTSYRVYLMMKDGLIEIKQLKEEQEIFMNSTYVFELKES